MAMCGMHGSSAPPDATQGAVQGRALIGRGAHAVSERGRHLVVVVAAVASE
jgi:hypothetical protein